MATTASSTGAQWLYEVSILFDLPFDVALALLCAGLVGPEGDYEGDLAAMGGLAAARRERRILDRLVQTARSTTGPALAIAALFEGKDARDLIVQAIIPLWDE